MPFPKPTLALALALLLISPGCATVDGAFSYVTGAGQRTVAEATVALTTADNVALACYTPATSPCAVQFAAQKAEVKRLAQTAHDDLKAAEAATSSSNLLTAAWNAITAYQSIVASLKN